MVTIKIFKNKQFYVNKWGDKEYLDGGEGDNTLITAALLTGKGLDSEEECIYEAYGETTKEAETALKNYIKSNPNHPIISRKEVIKK